MKRSVSDGDDAGGRPRTRDLVHALAQLDGCARLADVGRIGAEAALELLDADRVVFFRRTASGAWEAIGDADATRGAAQPHRSGVHPSLGEPATAPGEALLVAPIRGAALDGALQADRLDRGGRFDDDDRRLAHSFAEHLSSCAARLATIEAHARAVARLRTTFDALREGVVTLDAAGVVVDANAAARRMLEVHGAGVGTRIATIAALAPLLRLLGSPTPVDGASVRIGRRAFSVTARPIASTDSSRGTVVTLIENEARSAASVTSRRRYVVTDILGESPAMRAALEQVRRAARANANVLVTGETGTGKEVFAQAIHTMGPRAREPFVGVNCAAVPRELLEAELFGYSGGAFTGARPDGQVGKFELAGAGTILLDEIGDMPVGMQAKLLRVLQERALVRVGGTSERPMAARVIATTNRDLDRSVERGTFRLDLLHRLRVIHVHLSPLRERGSDVLLLARAFLERFARAQGRSVLRLSPAVERELVAHAWPGNVRELANVIEREVSLADPETTEISRLRTPLTATPSVPPSGVDLDEIATLAEVERRTILRAIEVAGNVPQAAAALGVSRAMVYAKLRAWGVDPPKRPSTRRPPPKPE